MFEVFRNGIDIMGEDLPESKEYEEYLITQGPRTDQLDKKNVWPNASPQ